MRFKITMYWDDKDAINRATLIEEAFNRVINFCPELQGKAEKPSDRSRWQICFNRVRFGEFYLEDIIDLASYGGNVVQRIMNKYPATENPEPVSLSMIQASRNLTDVLIEANEYVAKCVHEWLP